MSGKQLLECVYDHETLRPDRVWFTQPTGGGAVQDYTFSEAIGRARRMAAHLESLGFEPGSKIGIISKNCAHFIITELAIWMSGHTTVALYPTCNAETAGYVLDHSDAKLLFVGKLDGWDDIKPGVPDDLPRITLPLAPKGAKGESYDDIVAKTEPVAGKPSRADDDVALLIYTSGSTGQPKGVMHGFKQMTAATHGIIDALAFTENDRCLSYLPLAHVFERAYISCTSMVAGTHLFFAESLLTFVQDLQRARPTLFISVPRLWLKFQLGVFQKMPPKKLSMLLKIPILNNIVRKKVLTGLGLQDVRLAGSGSAPIPADLIAWYRSLGLNLLEGYAMSEDFAYSHLSTVEHNEPGYVGVPYAEVLVRLSDEGEILIKSPGCMLGYYKMEEETKTCFTDDGYFKTGDRGARKPSGLLKITGRVKEIFKSSKGKYIAPAPIENLLNNDQNIELSCVSGSGQPQPCAVVVLAEDLRPKTNDPVVRAKVEADMAALLSQVNGAIEHHEQLEFIAVASNEWSIANGMLTPTLKIRRGAIESHYNPHLEGWYETKQKVVWC
jgi:long-chain acyl-CoA synthetase